MKIVKVLNGIGNNQIGQPQTCVFTVTPETHAKAVIDQLGSVKDIWTHDSRFWIPDEVCLLLWHFWHNCAMVQQVPEWKFDQALWNPEKNQVDVTGLF